MLTPTTANPDIQRPVLAVAMLALGGIVWAAGEAGGTRLALAALVGGCAGLALYHASFGFTSAWRRFARERRGAGLRAQLAMIALTVLISYPLIAHGHAFGMPTYGWVLPFGVAAAFGAFIFGIGMQLGGGCASGTLFTVGGGSTRMVITLSAFIAGSVIATAHLPEWRTLPAITPVSSISSLGVIGALALTFALLAFIARVTVIAEKRQHGDLEAPRETGSVLTGPWSLMFGAVAIAFVGISTFLVLGRPWGITSAFALWGAKAASGIGIPIETWPHWAGQTARLEASVFTDGTSVMNFGIIAGAMVAAALAGRFSPSRSITFMGVLTAVIGGLLMGYGARLAYGCNIGAYLGGIVSGSLHGWGWLVFGYLGSLVGTRLRGVLRMD